MKVAISSGHGLYVRGASGYLDEVDEARRVVDRVAQYLRWGDVEVSVFHDDISTTQSENLDRIVDWHNAQGPHDYDVSVHFNAYETTSKPMGTEVLYVTQEQLAGELSEAIASVAGLPNRGAKYRSDLAFLNGTREKAVLIETVFVDSSTDADHYNTNFEAICTAIARGLAFSTEQPPQRPDRPERPPRPPQPGDELLHVTGAVSWFGGPADAGVDPDEDLAFIYDVETAPHLFLHEQPQGTSGLARRLDPGVFYIACRWDYDVTPKAMLQDQTLKAAVTAKGKTFLAYPADWGPHTDTGRVADISPRLMQALDLTTDDVVEVVYPAAESGGVMVHALE